MTSGLRELHESMGFLEKKIMKKLVFQPRKS